MTHLNHAQIRTGDGNLSGDINGHEVTNVTKQIAQRCGDGKDTGDSVDSDSGCVGTGEKKGHRAFRLPARNRGTTTKTVEGFEEKATAKELQIQRNECIRSMRRRLGKDPMHRNGEHRSQRIGYRSGAAAGENITRCVLGSTRVLQ